MEQTKISTRKMTKEQFVEFKREKNATAIDNMARVVVYMDKMFHVVANKDGFKWQCNHATHSVSPANKVGDKFKVEGAKEGEPQECDWPFVDDDLKKIATEHIDLLSEAEWDYKQQRKDIRKDMSGMISKTRKRKMKDMQGGETKKPKTGST